MSEQVKTKLISMMRQMLQFPYPQICRHSVALDIANLLTSEGVELSDELIRSITRADDQRSLEILGNNP